MGDASFFIMRWIQDRSCLTPLRRLQYYGVMVPEAMSNPALLLGSQHQRGNWWKSGDDHRLLLCQMKTKTRKEEDSYEDHSHEQ